MKFCMSRRLPNYLSRLLNTLRPRQNGRHFADIFKCIFLNENVWIPIRISLKFVPKCLIKNNPALVQIMAWRLPGDKPLSEPMTVSLSTHICVIRPHWVNTMPCDSFGFSFRMHADRAKNYIASYFSKMICTSVSYIRQRLFHGCVDIQVIHMGNG